MFWRSALPLPQALFMGTHLRVGEGGGLTVQAATCAPDLPIILIASRLTAATVEAASSDSGSEDDDGDAPMHADGGGVVHMAMVDGCGAAAAWVFVHTRLFVCSWVPTAW